MIIIASFSLQMFIFKFGSSHEPASLQRCFAWNLTRTFLLPLIPQCEHFGGNFEFLKEAPRLCLQCASHFTLLCLVSAEKLRLLESDNAEHLSNQSLTRCCTDSWTSLNLWEEPGLSWCPRLLVAFRARFECGLKQHSMTCFKYLGRILHTNASVLKTDNPAEVLNVRVGKHSVTVCAFPHQQLQGHFLVLEGAGMQFTSDSKLLSFWNSMNSGVGKRNLKYYFVFSGTFHV